MRLFKFGLHFWITMTSMLSFLAGWILLAHAPKPAHVNAATIVNVHGAPLPTLEPLAPINSGGDEFQIMPFQSVQPSTRSHLNPFAFITGGS